MASRLLSFRGNDVNQQKRMVDVILMASLAGGTLEQDAIDRIARALQTNRGFESVAWEWVLERAQELALDAPLFSDARAALISQLSDPARRELALSLAANIAGAERPLSEEENAILHELGLGFGMGQDEIELLLNAEGALGFLRSPCNTQEAEAPSLFDAIARTKDDDELRLLTYKLCAIRRVADEIFPGSVLASVGENLRVGEQWARVDAVLDLPDATRCAVRCLAEGEALHAAEHPVLSKLAHELKELSVLVIAHQGTLSPMDQAFLKELGSAKLRVEKVDIWEGVT